MRGADTSDLAYDLTSCGSPPRAWGRPGPNGLVSLLCRFTPTCVGQTRYSGHRAGGRPGSPPRAWGRRRGRPDRPHPHGSPPRAWGRLGHLIRQATQVRFTPTCVGQTGLPPPDGTSVAVHPHVRGADIAFSSGRTWMFGSPPRAWGRLAQGGGPRDPQRFTPTCVGQTTAGYPTTRRVSVHPHVRGADSTCTYPCRPTSGSPPRAWGRRCRSGPGTGGRSVHPHVRGADDLVSRVLVSMRGSPPRAWGRLGLVSSGIGGLRFTPTCVGQTLAAVTQSDVVCGSPPRAWGRRYAFSRPSPLPRFTPTCVGQTHKSDNSFSHTIQFFCLLKHIYIEGLASRMWERVVPALETCQGEQAEPESFGGTDAAGDGRGESVRVGDGQGAVEIDAEVR